LPAAGPDLQVPGSLEPVDDAECEPVEGSLRPGRGARCCLVGPDHIPRGAAVQLEERSLIRYGAVPPVAATDAAAQLRPVGGTRADGRCASKTPVGAAADRAGGKLDQLHFRPESSIDLASGGMRPAVVNSSALRPCSSKSAVSVRREKNFTCPKSRSGC